MRENFLLFLLPIYAILFFFGCTAKLTEPEIDFEPPAYVEQMPSREDKKDFIEAVLKILLKNSSEFSVYSPFFGS